MQTDIKDIDKLKQLLDEDISITLLRSHHSFDLLEEKIKSDGIILFGCGLFGKKILRGLKKIGINPIGFSDNNPKLWNTSIEGQKVFSPEEAAKLYPDSVFMVAIWSDVIGHPIDEIKLKLQSYNRNIQVSSFFHLFWKYSEIFLPYFSIDTPDKTVKAASLITECFTLFEDDFSRKEYLAQIKWRLWADYNGLSSPVSYTQYFPDDLFKINDKEIFVDCGAFDGDTLKNFLKKQNDTFGRYYGYEPDPLNFEKLKVFVSSLPANIREKIFVDQYAVSDKKKVINFSSDGSLQSSISESGNISVDCISIDEFLVGQQVSYIKMDAEGAEPDIITGSINTILKYNPILAISVYHNYNHLWILPLTIKQIYDNYKFFLRPHCKSSWDLVCYAVPKSRLKNT